MSWKQLSSNVLHLYSHSNPVTYPYDRNVKIWKYYINEFELTYHLTCSDVESCNKSYLVCQPFIHTHTHTHTHTYIYIYIYIYIHIYIYTYIHTYAYIHTGTAVAQWLRCCATNRKVAGSIPHSVIGIFHWPNPADRTMALGSTQPLTEMSTRRISWG